MVSRGLSQNPPPYAALAAGVVAAQPLLPRTTSRFGWLTLLFLAATLGFGPLALRAEPAANSSAPEATTYQIRNVKFGDLLRPRDANNANGTRLVLYPAQPWKCMTWRLQPAGESAFQVKNLFTAKTFGADAGTNAPQPKVTQLPLPKDGVDAPLWQFVRLADNSYKIIDAKSSQALTATKAEGGYEAKIVTSAWADLPEQKWQLEKMDPKELTM